MHAHREPCRIPVGLGLPEQLEHDGHRRTAVLLDGRTGVRPGRRPAASAAAGPVETEYVGAVDDFVHRVLGCTVLGWDQGRYQAEIGAPPEHWPAPTIRNFPGFTADFTAMIDEHQEHVTESMSQYAEHGLGVAEANTRAAIRAARALMSHRGVDPEPDSAIADHLADLMHLCDAVESDFEDMVERAYGHYSAELLGVV